MKKRILTIVLVLLLLLSTLPAMASTSEEEPEFDREKVVPELINKVNSFITENEYFFEFDDEKKIFSGEFELEASIETCEAMFYLYDDMLATTMWLPFEVPEDRRDDVAILLTKINSNIYYGFYRLNFETGEVSARSYILIESVLPGYPEIDVLLHQPLHYVEDYGDGIHKVAFEGADPHEMYTELIRLLELDVDEGAEESDE